MNRLIVIVISTVCLLSFVIACSTGDRPPTVEELLSLGEQFLLDGNYEQALVQFREAIEVEPMNPRGYTGAAEAYIGLGEYDRAREVLEDGQRAVGDDAGISGMLDDFNRAEEERLQAEIETEEAQQQAEREAEEARRQAEAEAEIMGRLEEFLTWYETDDFESIQEKTETVLFQNLMERVEEFPLILLNDEDFGIGVYFEWSTFFIYIGGYINNQRSGHGTWILGLSGNYRFVGEWLNDMPNGSGALYLRGLRIREGILVDGLWDGSVIHYRPDDARYPSYIVEYINGFVVILEESLNRDGVRALRVSDRVSWSDEGTMSILESEWVNQSAGVVPFSERGR